MTNFSIRSNKNIRTYTSALSTLANGQKNNKQPKCVCHPWKKVCKNVRIHAFLAMTLSTIAKKKRLFSHVGHSTPHILPHITLIFLVNYDDMPIGHMMSHSGWKKGKFFPRGQQMMGMKWRDNTENEGNILYFRCVASYSLFASSPTSRSLFAATSCHSSLFIIFFTLSLYRVYHLMLGTHFSHSHFWRSKFSSLSFVIIFHFLFLFLPSCTFL